MYAILSVKMLMSRGYCGLSFEIQCVGCYVLNPGARTDMPHVPIFSTIIFGSDPEGIADACMAVPMHLFRTDWCSGKQVLQC